MAFSIPRFAHKLAKHTDPDSSRYALGGVYVEPRGDKVRLTATDGKQLISVSRPNFNSDDGDKAVVVEGKRFDKSVRYFKSNGHKNAAVVLEQAVDKGDDFVHLTDGVASEYVPVVEGRYPRIDDVFDSFTTGERRHVFVDAKYLKVFAETIIEACKGKEKASVRLTFGETPDDAVNLLAIAEDGSEIRGVIMPLNIDKDEALATLPMNEQVAAEPVVETKPKPKAKAKPSVKVAAEPAVEEFDPSEADDCDLVALPAGFSPA